MKKLAFVCLFVPLAAFSQTIATRVAGILSNGVTGGSQGLVLKQLGVGVIAEQGRTTVFDPGAASAVVPLLYAGRLMQVETVTLQTPIIKYNNPAAGCPSPAVSTGTEPLGTALREMMWHSDNARTHAVQGTFTREALNNLARSLGLQTTVPFIPGCSTGATATLTDLAGIYEGVLNSTLLLPSERGMFLGMLSGKAQAAVDGTDFNHLWDTDIPNLITQEGPAGMTEAQKTSYRNSMDLGYKAGAVLNCTNVDCTLAVDSLSIAGWARVPFCSAGATVPRDYVFGVYISGAVDAAYTTGKQTAAQKAFLAAKAELLREQIRDGLDSCFGTESVLVSPAPGSTLSSRTVGFAWSGAQSATGYRLDLGRTLGGAEYGSQFTTQTGVVVTNLPCDNSVIYARLWTRRELYGNPKDYVYRACSNGGPVLTSPVPRTTLPSSSVTFNWSALSAADFYRLTVGSTLGGNDLALVEPTTTSATINNLPRDRVVFVRIMAHTEQGFTVPNDFAYNNQLGASPVITSVVNAASPLAGLSPSCLATLTGSNFGSDLVLRVDGTQAVIVGAPTSSQVTFIVPPNVAIGPRSFVITSGGASSPPAILTLTQTSPGVYSPLQDESGAPIPAGKSKEPGDTIMLRAVGVGQVGANGVPALPFRVTIGGISATLVSTSLSATAPGVLTALVKIPGGVSAGPQPLVAQAGIVLSNAVPLVIVGPSIHGVLNGASFATGGKVAPGSLISVFGSDLATEDKFGVFPSVSLPGGGVITVNGLSAPLFDVVPSGGQINLLVPFETPAEGSVPVVVANALGSSSAFQMSMAPVAPGIFRIGDPENSKRFNAAALVANTAWRVIPASMAGALGMPGDCSANRVNVSSICGEPAAPGAPIQIYVTGLGRATPNGNPVGNTLRTGDVAPAGGSPLYRTVETPVVTIGGIDARVTFSGIAPGFAGLYQINVEIPGGVAAGDDVPVTITIGGASDTATIAVRAR